MSEIEDYLLNVTEFPDRQIPAVYQPESIAELQALVLQANQNKTHLYTISTGHNWGLGSKLPVKDSSIVDLSGLNQVLEVNRELRYARIQPGVTQLQLFEYLEEHAPDLMVNVTGADAASSIIGNTLERGSGKNGHRVEDLRELKVMLTDGSVISTGYGGNPEAEASFYKYGIGPDMTHLFTQSNYGIVTEAVVDLRIKQPFNLYLVVFEKEKLGEFFVEMSQMVGVGVVGHSLEVDSQNDPKIFEIFEHIEADAQKWFAWFVIYGSEPILTAKDQVLCEGLSEVLDDLHCFHSEDAHDHMPVPVEVRLRRYKGEPSDHSLIATASRFGVDLSDKTVDLDLYRQIPGFRCVLPVVPFTTQGAEVVAFIEEYTIKLGLEPSISIIALNEFTLEVFARVYLDRNNETSVQAAAQWATGLLAELKNLGIFPYRLDVENMEMYLENMEDPSLDWKRQLKDIFDPNGIFSPGRYVISKK